MARLAIETDYLIIGCGAAGMGFADVLVKETNARIVMVDRHQSPGGHWNDAYPFVRLHHPSHYYGVHSIALGDKSVQADGFNKGLLHQATGPDIVSYYAQVMRQKLLPSGRVHYFPMSNYDGNGQVTSLLTGDKQQINIAKKTVDGTISGTTVPSTHIRPYSVAPGIACVPLNDLTKLTKPPSAYTVIGSGKTGMDACLWLLDQGVNPDAIRWIMPRDAWWIDRANAQFTDDYFDASVGGIAAQMEALAAATSVDDLFARLETCGGLLRLDPTVTPTMFHGATINRAELEQLRRIKDVVRLGRVQSIDATQVVLSQGKIPARADCLYVDCSAAGFAVRPVVPVFKGDTITLQMLKSFQPSFSAALIAHVEASYSDEQQKNALCTPVPPPKHATDWLTMMAASMANQGRWSADPALMGWILGCRLDPMTALMRGVDGSDAAKQAPLLRSRKSMRAAAGNLQTLLGHVRP
jgi:NAD(P)-binding Rossmann-like domain